jgi:hypothetical protein
LNFTRLEWLYTGSAAGVLSAAALALFLRSRWRRDPDEIERRRREYIGRVGRIAHAEILEVVESDEAPPAARRRLFALRTSSPAPASPVRRLFVVYRYWISGVSYETAQDLTGLASGLMLSAAQQSASVKYEPTNPSNSILAAENWSGLRQSGPGAATSGKGR